MYSYNIEFVQQNTSINEKPANMESSCNLDLLILRTAKRKDIAAYLIQLLNDHSDKHVCSALLAAVEEESIKPDVFSIFLSASKSVDSIVMCLEQESSVYVRRAGIKHFGRCLKHPHDWQKAWHAMQGTRGLLAYFATISVQDVQFFLQNIGSCNGGNVRSEKREQTIEELVQAMLPSKYPNAQLHSPEQRPLQYYVAQLVPACSSTFVQHTLREGPGSNNPLYSNVPRRQLIKAHGAVLQQYAFHNALSDATQKTSSRHHDFIPDFVLRQPSKQGDEPTFSASMSFSLKLLEKRVAKPHVAWAASIKEVNVYASLLHRCQRKSINKQRLHDIIELGLRLQEILPDGQRQFSGLDLWSLLRTFWKFAPETWEDLLIRALQLGLGGDYTRVGHEFMLDLRLDQARTWHLLRLYCKYVPKLGIDIEVDNDLVLLAKQKWWIGMFKRVEPEKAIKFLKKLITANKEYGFLRTSDPGSILREASITGQLNFNAWLLLTQMQSRSFDLKDRQEATQRAKDAVADLRQKSGSSRGQPSRAEFAKAACFFAISSGSLELYRDTLTWLKRFIRDPLTSKTLFHKDAISSPEGIDLLSGIPDVVSRNTSLTILSSSISTANDILLTFHAHRRLAQLEPSFQKRDWSAISSLVKSAITTRIARVSKIQEHLNVDDGELYSAIWNQTFEMLSEVGADSLKELEYEIQVLMSKLSPQTLAATTKSMLAADDRCRAETHKKGEAWDEFKVIERLTYHCLLRLAKGDKPVLAKDLIIKTIIDRPDASSWHRQLLNVSYLKKLPAGEAKEVLLRFATAVGEKLEEQAYVRVGEAVYASSLVKVTTVKYLAQLLEKAEFISGEAAVDVLVELFKAGTHPDIRQATLESLLSCLNGLCFNIPTGWPGSLETLEDPLIPKILKVLETVIPVIGSVNERRPPQDADWKEALLDNSKLPEVYSSASAGPGLPPLLHTILGATTSNQWPGLRRLKDLFVERLILPTMEHAIAEHTRWLRLFLAQHDQGLNIDVLPSIPIAPMLLSQMVSNFTDTIPGVYLDRMTTYMQFILQPSTELQSFNNRLKKDVGRSNQAGVKHWLSVFDHTRVVHTQQHRFMLIDLLHHPWKDSKVPYDRAIRVEHIHEAILAEVGILLNNYEANIVQWDALTNKLHHRRGSKEEYRNWNENCRALLTSVLVMVLAKRTPQWLADPQRKPSFLPPTRKMSFWLLYYPIVSGNEDELVSQCLILGSELLSEVRRMLVTDNIVLGDMVSDVLTISEKLNDAERLQLAILLGSTSRLEQPRTVEEALLRINVAMRLLEAGNVGKSASSSVKQNIRHMVLGWEHDASENIRRRTFEWKMDHKALCQNLLPAGLQTP